MHLILLKIQNIIASMAYNSFDQKTSNTNRGTAINCGAVSDIKELEKELRKPIIKKSEKRKVNSRFINNIWSANLGYLLK